MGGPIRASCLGEGMGGPIRAGCLDEETKR